MYVGKTLFAQIMDFLSWKTFHRIVSRYDGDYRVRTLNCAEHFRILAFAQLTYRESLRDIEACLSAYLCRICQSSDRSSPETLRQRRLGAGLDQYRLRLGFNDY
jgi:hypothetical protein